MDIMIFFLLCASLAPFISACECWYNGATRRYLFKGLLGVVWLPLLVAAQPAGWTGFCGQIIGVITAVICLITGLRVALKGSSYSGRERPGGTALVVVAVLLIVTVIM